MATLYDARIRAIDSDGDPLVGATLTINVANTSTPAPIFRDAALTVPMTNPTSGADVSDAGGWFPQIFATEGTLVDITLKNSAGATVKTYVDVSFLGSNTGEFERTLADDTRFSVRGSGGVVYMEFGDPSPDNSGGTAVIGGWVGTQADLITVNAALFNVIGQIKENSKKLFGVVATEAVTVTAQTSVDIALPNLPAGTRAWEIEIFDFSISGSGVGGLLLQMAYDSAPTTFVAAGYSGFCTNANSTSGVTLSTVGTTEISLIGSLGGAANQLGVGRIRLITPNSGSDAVKVSSNIEGINNLGQFLNVQANAYGPTVAGRLAAVRLSLNGVNTFSFKYLVRSLRGYGEA